MNHSKFFILLCGLVFSAPTFAKPIHQQIVGGVEAAVGEFPFIVSLQSGYHFCGGSLIKKNWVLTAAHCADGGHIDQVVIGGHDVSDSQDGERKHIKRIIVHPNYDSSSADFDFALLELDSDSAQKPVALNSQEINITPLSEIMSTTAGWGDTQSANRFPDKLQKVDVPLVTFDKCQNSYGTITDRMICAGYDEGAKDSCQGDSGGPLMIENSQHEKLLVGVVSWGHGCALPQKYGVYAKVNSVYQWIETNTK
jgi:trypsin